LLREVLGVGLLRLQLCAFGLSFFFLAVLLESFIGRVLVVCDWDILFDALSYFLFIQLNLELFWHFVIAVRCLEGWRAVVHLIWDHKLDGKYAEEQIKGYEKEG